MGANHANQVTFRESLEAPQTGRWAAVAGEINQELARRLGVTSEVLDQAISERADELSRRGKAPRKLGNRAGYEADHATLEVTMPPQVHEHWIRFCKSLGMWPSAVLRSLVHHFLLTKRRPRTIGRTWLLRGKFRSIKPTGRVSTPRPESPGARR